MSCTTKNWIHITVEATLLNYRSWACLWNANMFHFVSLIVPCILSKYQRKQRTICWAVEIITTVHDTVESSDSFSSSQKIQSTHLFCLHNNKIQQDVLVVNCSNLYKWHVPAIYFIIFKGLTNNLIAISLNNHTTRNWKSDSVPLVLAIFWCSLLLTSFSAVICHWWEIV